MFVRLFLDHPIVPHCALSIHPTQDHYLRRVMRCKTGDIIHIFNGQQGLWQASLARSCHVIPEKKVIEQPDKVRTVALAFSPIKQQNWLVEKGTEMGVTDFYPILCHRTVIRHFSQKRHVKITHEACEQSQRLHIPTLHPLQTLHTFIHSQEHTGLSWTVLDPTSHNPLQAQKGTIALCIGPEGGWSPQERASFSCAPHIYQAHIGSGILRAETAAVASLAVAQSTP